MNLYETDETTLFRSPTSVHATEHSYSNSSWRSLSVVDNEQGKLTSQSEKLIHLLFEAQASRTPDAIAVTHLDEELRYEELNRRADQLAHRLRELGVCSESLVGLCMERSLETIVGILGILKAGGAYVPLDPSYPQNRLDFTIQDAGIRVMVCDNGLIERFRGCDLQFVNPRLLHSPTPDQPLERLDAGLTSANAAYVIYTSGSTGQPKGCVVTHGNVIRLFRTTESLFQFDADDVWTLFHSFAFDFSVWEIWGALLYGGRLIIVPFAISRSPHEFLDLVIDQGVTVLNQTPSAFRQLMLAAELRPDDGQRDQLRQVIFGGEALDPRMLRPWLNRYPGTGPALVNMYGITETTVHVTYHRLTAEDIERGGSPIGRPLPDLRVYLLDEQGQPVPVGIPGEIYVAGPGLARGYLNRPELTAQRFVASPFPEVEQGPLYRSGDLARALDDGKLEFLGRIDHQVKIRGHRIELGEIEAALADHPAIATAAVIASQFAEDDVRLIGYYVPRESQAATHADLDRHLRQRLPDYMVPAALVPLTALPLTINGKLDQSALPSPEMTRPRPQSSSSEPQTLLETQLADIWKQVLGIGHIGIQDHFFELGGHSLLAMRIVAEFRKLTGRLIPVRWIFESPTIEQLSHRLQQLDTQPRQLRPIEVSQRQDLLPVSFGQQGMWLLQQTLPNPATYNQPIVWRFSQMVNLPLLERAFRELLERHEILRSAFVIDNDELCQQACFISDLVFPFSHVSLQSLDADHRQAKLQQTLDDEIRRPFNLAVAPLFRALWISLSDGDHLFVVTFHHSIIDEWSVRLLARELSDLYSALEQAIPADLPALAIQYADFARWQREELQGDQLTPHRLYWQQQLAGLTQLDLPRDRARPSHPTGQGALHEFRLSGPVTGQLRTLATDESTTLFPILLGAFQVWLARASGQSDIVVGTPYAFRDHAEIQSLIGYFLNTLPIRAQIDPALTFREFLKSFQQTILDAFSHADFPFEQMVELSVQGRDHDAQPIYHAMFVLLEEGFGELRLGNQTGVPSSVHTGTSKNDLLLDIQATGDNWTCRIEYSTDLFDASTIARMAGHLQELFQAIAAQPDEPIAQLNIMPAHERQQVLVEWNHTCQEFPRHLTVHQLFEEQAVLTPQACALVFQNQRFTYEELNRRADRLAHRLRGLGIGPDQLVGFCLDRSPETFIAILGILKAGAAYVPLDATLPPQRLKFLIDDALCRVVLTTEQQRSQLASLFENPPSSTPDWLILNEHTWTADEFAGPLQTTPAEVTPRHLAYVIYTSGSTGQPKGVAMHHRALVNLITWQRMNSRVRAGDRTLQFASPGFDVSFQEIFSTWCSGGTLVLLPDEIRLEPHALIKEIAAQRIRRLYLPVVMLQRIADTADSWTAPPQELAEVIVAGEQLRITDPIRQMFQRLPCCRLINHYGPTETHVVTSFELDQRSADWSDLPPIGRPIANTQIYLLDPQRNPVPVGVTGELWIGGEGVARGYWRRPTLTTERFLPDPFAADSDARMYRTGDLARWRPDGEIEYLGRADHQVKIRGYRVELSECEVILSSHPQLRASSLIAHRNSSGELVLVAFVVPREKQAPEAAELKGFLQTLLPDYMIPSRFISLPALPVTTNGKVDRKGLEHLASTQRDESTSLDYVAPQTELQWAIAEVWESILGRHQIGLHDNFFELGGHSLQAMRCAAQLKNQLDLDMAVKTIFEFPTIESLSRHLAHVHGETATLPPIHPVDRQTTLPASLSQQSLWLIEQFLPGQATYHLPLVYRLPGGFDRDRLLSALHQMLCRHEVLRTALIRDNDQLVQRIVPIDELAVPFTETRLTRQLTPAELTSRIQAELRRPFSLEQAPLWRLLQLTLAGGDSVVVFTFHHIIFDEWSMRLFVAELSSFYAPSADQQPSQLPQLRVQFADYAAWQREVLPQLHLPQIDYWKQQLANLPAPLELPTVGTRPVELSGEGATHHFQIPRHTAVELRKLARHEATSLFSVVLSAFQVWLARYSGQQDIVVGTPYANRSRAEVQGLLGYFLNTLPIRTTLTEAIPFRQVVRQVRQTLWGAFSHADLPFAQIVEHVVRERQLGRHPIYQVMFVLLEEGPGQITLGDVTGDPLAIDTGTAKNELTLAVLAQDDDWTCQFEYSTELFDSPTIHRMAQHFQQLLDSIVQQPELPIERLNLVPPAERELLLSTWNQTDRNYPADLGIHQLFEAQVRRTPHAIALTCRGTSWTYQQLNQTANQFSRHLRSLGVGPDALVGVCLNRSPSLVATLLGILKAGAAYVPLDPLYPRDRLKFIATDASLRVLITERTLASSGEQSLVDGIPVVLIDDDLSAYDTSNPDYPTSPRDLAYLIYTSGSTGQPKGVAIEHRNAVSFLHWIRETFTDEELAGVLGATSVCFDLSIFELFGTLAWGGRVILVDQALDLLNDPHRDQVKLLNTVPSVAAALLQANALPTSLITVNLAGEPLATPLVNDLYALPHLRTVNDLYGPSETTTYSTWTRREPRQPATIGKPLANTQVYLLDEQLHPVPLGFVGELWIGGAGVAREYWQRPALTDERFRPNPFADQTDTPGRMYRTGDLARWRTDGQLEYLGRIDQQIKIRGYRIELGEIETILARHPDIRACAVVPCTPSHRTSDSNAEKELVAFIVLQASTEPAAADLRAWLARTLPEYMLPTRFFTLTELPQNANRKLDRKALMATAAERIGQHSSPLTSQHQPPQTPSERLVADVFERVLGVQQVGRHDNFFELGGHSLRALRVIEQLRQHSAQPLKVATLFTHATVCDLARYLTDSSQPQPASSELTYLESIRPGSGQRHLIVVGAKLRVPLEEIASDVSVWWLKLDGLHVLPHLQLDIHQQATRFVDELTQTISAGTLILCGHSLGGLLAIETANQLRHQTAYRLELVLLEPSPLGLPLETIRERLARHLQALRRPNRFSRVQHLVKTTWKKGFELLQRRPADPATVEHESDSTDERWERLLPYTLKHIANYNLATPLDQALDLITTPDYLKQYADTFPRLTTGPITPHLVEDHLNHLDIAEPEHAHYWVNVVKQILNNPPPQPATE